MPTYVYETIPADKDAEPRRFEVRQRMSDAALKTDPATGLPVRRVISGGLEIPRGKPEPRAPRPRGPAHGSSCPCCH